DAVPGEPVQVRRLDLGVLIPDVAPTQVIGDEQQHVGRSFRLVGGQPKISEKEECTRNQHTSAHIQFLSGRETGGSIPRAKMSSIRTWGPRAGTAAGEPERLIP